MSPERTDLVQKTIFVTETVSTLYEKYKDSGGVLSQKEYDLLKEELSGGQNTDFNSVLSWQAEGMTLRSGILAKLPANVLLTYDILRDATTPINGEKSVYPSLSGKCDQIIFAESLRLNGMNDKCQEFTSKYPNIFNGS